MALERTCGWLGVVEAADRGGGRIGRGSRRWQWGAPSASRELRPGRSRAVETDLLCCRVEDAMECADHLDTCHSQRRPRRAVMSRRSHTSSPEYAPYPRQSTAFDSPPRARRERLYVAAIGVLILWNIYLQVSTTTTVGSAGMFGRGPASYRSSSTGDESTIDFVNPEESQLVVTFGSAKVVCSGCSPESDANGTTGGNISNTSAAPGLPSSGPAAQAALVPANSSATALPINTSSVAANARAPSSPSKVAALLTRRMPEGELCETTLKGDSKKAMCSSFCTAKYAKPHCQRCKCRSCDFCPLPDPPPPPPAASPPPEQLSVPPSTSSELQTEIASPLGSGGLLTANTSTDLITAQLPAVSAVEPGSAATFNVTVLNVTVLNVHSFANVTLVGNDTLASTNSTATAPYVAGADVASVGMTASEVGAADPDAMMETDEEVAVPEAAADAPAASTSTWASVFSAAAVAVTGGLSATVTTQQAEPIDIARDATDGLAEADSEDANIAAVTVPN